ncbi:MAG: hypothetical protein U0905_06860 [Pirellulales bacterium]
MTLLGKVFTALILVLSVAFFTVAMLVNATHNKWRDAVMDSKNGYKVQIDRLKSGNQQLKDQLARVQQEIALEQGARRATLAALQTQYQQVFTEKERLTAELTQLQAQHPNESNVESNANRVEASHRLQREDHWTIECYYR